jgi:hypothetical protein
MLEVSGTYKWRISFFFFFFFLRIKVADLFKKYFFTGPNF